MLSAISCIAIYQEKTGMDKLEEKQTEEYRLLEAKTLEGELMQAITNVWRERTSHRKGFSLTLEVMLRRPMKGGENMQSTAVQMKTRTAQEIKKEAPVTSKSNDDSAEFVDPFLQIIMNLLAQTQDQSTQQSGTSVTAGPEQLSELVTLLPSSPTGMAVLQNMLLSSGSSSDADTDSANTATAITAALMNMQAEPEISTESSLSVPSANYEQTAQRTNLSDLLNLFGKSANNSGNIAVSADALTQMTDLLGISSKDEMQALFKNAGITVVYDGLGTTQSGLSEAVVTAKQMLSDYLSQQPGDQEDIDVDKLQNELAKTDAATPFELQFKSAGNAADSKVLEQVTDGIKQNISLGKSEFVIKLKPEALGEITVKLVEEAGKTTLSITTASAQTAKLINNDIDALRKAVAPMNVEVHYAVTSSNETAGGSMQQFNMSGQQFAEQQFAGQQSILQMSQAVSGKTDSQTVDDMYESSQPAQLKFISGDRLDAYI